MYIVGCSCCIVVTFDSIEEKRRKDEEQEEVCEIVLKLTNLWFKRVDQVTQNEM